MRADGIEQSLRDHHSTLLFILFIRIHRFLFRTCSVGMGFPATMVREGENREVYCWSPRMLTWLVSH
jgi:hypothetical protein